MKKLIWQWFKDMSKKKNSPSQVPCCKKKHSNLPKSFRERNNIAFYIKSGEKPHVDIAIAEDWKEKLPTILEGYNPSDIFNMNEKGFFFTQQRTKLCTKKVKNAVVVRKQRYNWLYLLVQIWSVIRRKKLTKKLGWHPVFLKLGQRNLVCIWVIKVEKFCYSWIMLCHIQMFNFVMWNWSSCQPIQSLFCNHLQQQWKYHKTQLQ